MLRKMNVESEWSKLNKKRVKKKLIPSEVPNILIGLHTEYFIPLSLSLPDYKFL